MIKPEWISSPGGTISESWVCLSTVLWWATAYSTTRCWFFQCQWCLLNHFCTEQGNSAASRIQCGLSDNDICARREVHAIFGRPFVKRFALCYWTVVCLWHWLYCGQTVGWIKMKLGMVVRLGPGHIVLDGNPAPPPPKKRHRPQFSAHVRCGQTTGWIKMPLGVEVALGIWIKMALGVEVGLGQGHIVLDGPIRLCVR